MSLVVTPLLIVLKLLLIQQSHVLGAVVGHFPTQTLQGLGRCFHLANILFFALQFGYKLPQSCLQLLVLRAFVGCLVALIWLVTLGLACHVNVSLLNKLSLLLVLDPIWVRSALCSLIYAQRVLLGLFLSHSATAVIVVLFGGRRRVLADFIELPHELLVREPIIVSTSAASALRGVLHWNLVALHIEFSGMT